MWVTMVCRKHEGIQTLCGIARIMLTVCGCLLLSPARFVTLTQAGKLEDPRLKDVKAAVAKPTASCDSSVCPDPEPVPGFQQRSTWMAGQRAASASPPPSGLHTQVRAASQLCSIASLPHLFNMHACIWHDASDRHHIQKPGYLCTDVHPSTLEMSEEKCTQINIDKCRRAFFGRRA